MNFLRQLIRAVFGPSKRNIILLLPDYRCMVCNTPLLGDSPEPGSINVWCPKCSEQVLSDEDDERFRKDCAAGTLRTEVWGEM